MVDVPERIWIESDGECPYFYHEEELSDVAPPITEYVRADKLQAEVAALREALKEIRSRSSIDLAMRPDPVALTAELGDIHQIADAMLKAREASTD